MISSIESAISAIAAAAAAIAAAVAIWFAWKALREAQATTRAQREVLRATQEATSTLERVVVSTEAVAQRTESSVGALTMILAEAQASRELEHLHRIAEQLGQVSAWRRSIRGGPGSKSPWHDLEEAQRFLVALLAAFPAEALPNCRAMGDPDPRFASTALDDQAAEELRQAVAAVRERIATAARDASSA